MAKKIFLVIGSTGRYDDRTEWHVAAYTLKRQAERHAELANGYAELIAKLTAQRYNDVNVFLRKKPSPYDPDFSMDVIYNDATEYTVVEVALNDIQPKQVDVNAWINAYMAEGGNRD